MPTPRQAVSDQIKGMTPEQATAIQDYQDHGGWFLHNDDPAIKAMMDNNPGMSKETAVQSLHYVQKVAQDPKWGDADNPEVTQWFANAKQGQPGSQVDTTQADADRARMGGILTQLQGQAQTGNGAWQSALRQSTNQANAGATALGQSEQGVSNTQRLRDVGNATAGNTQRAAGQADTLRAQTQQDATSQISSILGQQAGTDASEAAAVAAARQATREAQVAQENKSQDDFQGTMAGAAKAGMSIVGAFSRGGKVPGKPAVFGDDEKNDIVPAKLSPGEIVLPRSVTQAPDAPGAAASFVAALKARHGAQKHHFAAGGGVGLDDVDSKGRLNTDTSIQTDPPTGNGGGPMATYGLKNMPNGAYHGLGNLFGMGPEQQRASEASGALLQTGNYNESRDAQLANATRFEDQMAGKGPSVAPSAMRAGSDASLAAAMANQAGAHGAGRAASLGANTALDAQQSQSEAGKAASTVAGESSKGAQQAANAIARQRAQDLAFAQARQQAAWTNTMMNAGIGLQQQAQMKGLLSGAGQAAMSIAPMFTESKDAPVKYDADAGMPGSEQASIDQAFNAPVDYAPMGAGPDSAAQQLPASIDEGGYAAHGGEVRGDELRRSQEFVAALRRRS